MNLRTLAAAATLALMLLAASCSSHRQAATTEPAAPIALTAASTPAERFAAMTANYGPWHDVQLNVKAAIEAPLNISASGKLTIVRDSLVHLSLRVFGLEVAVARITHESIYIIDKIHSSVLHESTAALTARTGITLADVQSALLGRAFIPGSGQATAADAQDLNLTDSPDGTLTITPRTPSAAYTWQMQASTLSDTLVTLTALRVQAAGRSASATFTPSTTLTPIGAIAQALTLSAPFRGKKIAASLRYTLSSARFNTYPAPTLPNLSGYSPLKL